MSLEKHFFKIIDFLKEKDNLISCHLVDFFTENLWDHCLPLDLRLYAEEKSDNIIREIEEFEQSCLLKNDSKLHSFLKDIESLKIEKFHNILSRSEFFKILNHEKTEIPIPLQSKYMKDKKWHEVNIFTKTVVWVNEGKKSIVIDAGAGKGYSSLLLSSYYNLPVLAVECSKINHKSAILYNDLVNKKTKDINSLIQYSIEQIDESTDFLRMLERQFPDLSSKNLVITALHGCGSLSDSVIKVFLNVNEMKSLCVVPCCYHLSSKSLFTDFEFSKNARMLAQQSIERIKQKQDALSPTLYYRAILQVILKNIFGIENFKVGRGAPTSDFVTYVKWALKKIDAKKIISDEEIEKIYEEYRNFEWKFKFFQLLRIQLAPIIEAAIILDKFLFLQNSKICTDLKLVQLFDPLISPRSWAIIAKK